MLAKEKIQLLADMVKDVIIETMRENDQVATGETIRRLRTDIGESHFAIIGPAHFGALQYGRQPTRNAGNNELYPKILQWVNAKGIVFNDGIKNSKYTIQERTAKTITYFIHKRGTYLYQNNRTFNGKENPILRNINPELIANIRSEIVGDFSTNVRSEVFPILKQLSQ